MKQETLQYINDLLKEKDSINEAVFLGFDLDQNTESYIERINRDNEKIFTYISDLEIEENAYSEDTYSDIEVLDSTEMEELFEYDYTERAIEVIRENFSTLEDFLSDYDLEMPEELKEEFEKIKSDLSSDKINIESENYYSVLEELKEIAHITLTAEKEKSNLEEIIEELEDAEKDLEFYRDEDQLEDYDKIITELVENKVDLINVLKSHYSDIDWKIGDINQKLEKNKYVEMIEEKLEEYKNNIFEEVLDLLEEKEPKIRLNQATNFIESNNSITTFLQNKENVAYHVQEHIKLSQNQDIQEMKIFSDKSIALKKREGWEATKVSKYSYYIAAMDVSKSIIEYESRKKPKFIKLFKTKLLSEKKLDNILDTMKFLFKLEPVLKNKQIEPLKDFKNKKVETIYDQLMKLEKEHKVEQYAKKLLSNKYKHFITPKSIKTFEAIVEANITRQHIQENVGVKLASYKTPEKFEEALQEYLNLINKFDKKSVIEKSKNRNCDIIFEEGDLLILKVKDYSTCNYLGKGTSWCISRSESFFNSYVKSPSNSQYFVYDFSKDSKNPECMIGVTIKPKGDHRAAHLKNDKTISETDIFELKEKILQNDAEIQRTLSENSKDKFNIQENKKKHKLKP